MIETGIQGGHPPVDPENIQFSLTDRRLLCGSKATQNRKSHSFAIIAPIKDNRIRNTETGREDSRRTTIRLCFADSALFIRFEKSDFTVTSAHQAGADRRIKIFQPGKGKLIS